jgi:2-oxoglutarate ferredoxin oxidoreductase subunit alpha
MFDYVIKAFWAAWKFRFPAFVLGDGYQAKMREPVTIYDPEDVGVELPVVEPILKPKGVPSVDREPVHMRNTFNIEEELMDALMEHIHDYSEMEPQVVESEKHLCEDAEILVVAHGIVWRSAKEAVFGLRERGINAGAFRPITLRPFPEDDLKAAARTAKLIVVAESAYGQLESMVRDRLYGSQVPMTGVLKPGAGITAEEIVEGVTQLVEMSRSEG